MGVNSCMTILVCQYQRIGTELLPRPYRNMSLSGERSSDSWLASSMGS